MKIPLTKNERQHVTTVLLVLKFYERTSLIIANLPFGEGPHLTPPAGGESTLKKEMTMETKQFRIIKLRDKTLIKSAVMSFSTAEALIAALVIDEAKEEITWINTAICI